MAKIKKPAPKGGKKNAAPKKVAKRAPATKKLTARQIDQFNADKMRADAKAAADAAQGAIDKLRASKPIVTGWDMGCSDTTVIAKPLHPTVEEQFERDAALYGAPPARFDPTKHGVVGIDHETGVTFHNGTMPKPGLLRRAWNGVKRAFRYRSAKDGEYVTKQYAQANPDTTVREKA